VCKHQNILLILRRLNWHTLERQNHILSDRFPAPCRGTLRWRRGTGDAIRGVAGMGVEEHPAEEYFGVGKDRTEIIPRRS